MRELEQARILVIDDDETVRRSLEVALKANGYEVDIAENGKEAITKSKARLYNLALIDVLLPDMDGMELLTAMREAVPKMIKIIITGYPSMENAIEAVNRDADGYIVKPYKMEHLLLKIKEQLRKQQEARKYSEEKVKEFIEARTEEYEARASEPRRQEVNVTVSRPLRPRNSRGAGRQYKPTFRTVNSAVTEQNDSEVSSTRAISQPKSAQKAISA